eukprot:scaffold4886_cov123-Isochrysis_galbana.AAC.4
MFPQQRAPPKLCETVEGKRLGYVVCHRQQQDDSRWVDGPGTAGHRPSPRPPPAPPPTPPVKPARPVGAPAGQPAGPPAGPPDPPARPPAGPGRPAGPQGSDRADDKGKGGKDRRPPSIVLKHVGGVPPTVDGVAQEAQDAARLVAASYEFDANPHSGFHRRRWTSISHPSWRSGTAPWTPSSVVATCWSLSTKPGRPRWRTGAPCRRASGASMRATLRSGPASEESSVLSPSSFFNKTYYDTARRGCA